MDPGHHVWGTKQNTIPPTCRRSSTALYCHNSRGSILAVVTCNQESQLQCLLLVESRIAVGGVVQAQVLIVEPLAATSTFSNRIASELEVHAAQERAVLLVDLQG
jgi:hypothetical protein